MLGLKITSGITYASQGKVVLILLLTMVTCLLLSIVPTRAACILTESIAASLLIGYRIRV